ncbi:MAG: antitoxin [Dermatophilaceae bacterium]
MGMFDEIKGKAEELLHGHADKVEELSDQGIAKATDAADSATGGKYSDQIDAAGGKADELIGE